MVQIDGWVAFFKWLELLVCNRRWKLKSATLDHSEKARDLRRQRQLRNVPTAQCKQKTTEEAGHESADAEKRAILSSCFCYSVFDIIYKSTCFFVNPTSFTLNSYPASDGTIMNENLCNCNCQFRLDFVIGRQRIFTDFRYLAQIDDDSPEC